MRRMTVGLAASAVLVLAFATGSVAGDEPPAEPGESTPAPVSETMPADTAPPTTITTTTTTVPEETGEIDGVEVAVGLPPVPPLAPPTEVGNVDGVEVAVGLPPVPPTATTSAARPSGQRVEAPSQEPNNVITAESRLDAIVAATQLIESIETIDILLDAWT